MNHEKWRPSTSHRPEPGRYDGVVLLTTRQNRILPSRRGRQRCDTQTIDTAEVTLTILQITMTFCHDNFGRETANALMQVTKFLAVLGDVQINESRLGTVSFCYVEEGHLENHPS